MHPATTAASPPIIMENTAKVLPAYLPPDAWTAFIAHPPLSAALRPSANGSRYATI
jgi:hypothetical protein